MGSGRVRVPEALAGRGGERPLPTFDVPYFKYIDEEDEEDEWSSRSQSSTEDDSGDSLLSDRYVVVSGTPEKILEHLLSDLHLEAAQDKETGKERAWRGGGGGRARGKGVGPGAGPGAGRAARGSLPGTPGRKPLAAGRAAGRCGRNPRAWRGRWAVAERHRPAGAGAPAAAEPLGSNLNRFTFGCGCRRGSAGCGGLCTAPCPCRQGCHPS